MRLSEIVRSCVTLFVCLLTLEFNSWIFVEGGKGRRKWCKLVQNSEGRYIARCPQGIPEEGTLRTLTRRGGRRGRKGEKGKPGPPGPPGPPGREGKNGGRGPMGPPGPSGEKGEKGSQGPRGIDGKKGTKGEMGIIGPKGPPGLPGNCVSESSVFHQRNGAAIHCLPGPVGPQGEKGTSGFPGSKGDQGEKGELGQKGERGATGGRGPVGLPGLPGSLGKIVCSTRYTEWTRLDDIQSGRYQVFCGAIEYLQGFSLEARGSEVRYRYNCCAFS